MALIDVKNLHKSYSDGETVTKVLLGVNFSIDKGEFVAIMGPSGSGKSTLLHILGFLDTLSSGSYFFDGKSVADYSEEELAKLRNEQIGFVFQSFNLLPRTSVLDNVMMPLVYSNVPESEWRSRAEKAVESVGLAHRLNHDSSGLSGGEKQRVAIARALINRPKVIFADEPTGNLDSKSGKAVMDIIQKLNQNEGHTIILITHETYTAEHAGRIIKILDGEVESDRKVEVRRQEFVK